MPLGTHWEWRGFGTVSADFERRYDALPLESAISEVQDLYFYAPGMTVNLKVRQGAEEGLKFKRPLARQADLEKWREDPHEVYQFPLSREAWDKLAAELARLSLPLAPYPQQQPDQEQTIRALEQAGCRSVMVVKRRLARRWSGAHADVLIERAQLSGPQSILSIGLECDAADAADAHCRDDLRAAVQQLGLEKEPLRVMNYMDALAAWAAGREIAAPPAV